MSPAQVGTFMSVPARLLLPCNMHA